MNDLARAANVNKASVYQYFISKDALCLEIIEFHREQIEERVFEDIFKTHTNPMDRLDAIYQKVFAVHNEIFKATKLQFGCPLVNLANELGAYSEPVRLAVEKAFNSVGTYYTIILEDLHGASLSEHNKDRVTKSLLRNMNGAMIATKIQKSPDAILSALPTAKLIATNAIT